jgi:hypothetical protein
MTQAYIGFSELSKFIRAIDHDRDMYLAPLTIVKNGDLTSTVTVSLVASQTKRDHLIYCKIDVSRWAEMYGKPFGDNNIERAARSTHLQQQMWEFIVERLRAGDPDLEIFDGAPSFPSDLMLVPGIVEGVIYDDDLKSFVELAAGQTN